LGCLGNRVALAMRLQCVLARMGYIVRAVVVLAVIATVLAAAGLFLDEGA